VSIFVDTSAVLSVLIDTDEFHAQASETWRRLLDGAEPLVTTNYTVVEFCSLAQRRLGVEAVRFIRTTIVPVLNVEWVDPLTHDEAVEAVLTAHRRDLSIVDCASFITMRRSGITSAFTFDSHFAEQGFDLLPGAGLLPSASP